MFTSMTSLYHRTTHHFFSATAALSDMEAAEATAQAELKDSPVRLTYIYVDMDNVIGQLHHPRVARMIARRFDWLLLTLAEQYTGSVEVLCYGNLSYHRVKERHWQYEQCQVRYIDTPVVGESTLTDTEMEVDMLDNLDQEARTVLVSCDVDFQPVAQRCQDRALPFEVIQFGRTNYKLLSLATRRLNGRHLLDQSGLLNRDTAKEILQTFLAEQGYEASLSAVSSVLADYQGQRWQRKGNVGRFVESLAIPNLVVSRRDNTVSLKGHVWKLRMLKSPVLSQAQYAQLFRTLSEHTATTHLASLSQAVAKQCAEKGVSIEESEVHDVVMKVLPAMGRRGGAERLAQHYLQWLHRKSRLVKNVYLSTLEREQLAQLILG